MTDITESSRKLRKVFIDNPIYWNKPASDCTLPSKMATFGTKELRSTVASMQHLLEKFKLKNYKYILIESDVLHFKVIKF